MAEWKCINELKEINESLANRSYSMEYLDENGLLDEHGYHMWNHFGISSYLVNEPLQITLENNEVVWRRDDSLRNSESLKEYETCYGMFVSDDRGEFGGILKTPFVVLDGNFKDVFDFQEKVYAIDSLSHMMSLHFSLYEFDEDGQYRIIYSVGSLKDWLENDKFFENFGYQRKYIIGGKLYVLISGYITNNEAEQVKRHKTESRLLEVENGRIVNIYIFPEDFSAVSGLIVKDNIVYIAQDKMLTQIDLTKKNITRYTYLDMAAIENLQRR